MALGPIFVLSLSLSVPLPVRREPPASQSRIDGVVTIHVRSGGPVNVFRPDEALGAGVDGHEMGDSQSIYTQENLRAMKSAGLRPLTYRLRTELGVESWHWNPDGRWSDPKHRQGYWTSSPMSAKPIDICYGYRLPRRGSTIDQANNDGYSRIDDGDPTSFWKSNPYLDQRFTGDSNAVNPQWFVVDLGKVMPIDAIRIRWGQPFATRFVVEYWKGIDAIYINENPPGFWTPFPRGAELRGAGGSRLVRLSANSPVSARFVRVTMTEPSGTAPPGSRDIRDRLGFAVREVELGKLDSAGRFIDYIKHGRNAASQTLIYASSTDPWHRASDLDPRVEQPGFDRVFRSGLTHDLPCLVPVPVLYDTPQNAVNALRFIRSRGYRFSRVEMGEEPDGQFASPEHYAALYVQWAKAIHRFDSHLNLGGPCFQSTITDVSAWPDHAGNRSWLNRFLGYIGRKGRASDLQFFSFEWYPFDDVCADASDQLARAPTLLSGVLNRWRNDGLTPRIPWFITEYGYSAFAGQPEVELPGALLNADIVGQFLTMGGSACYLYGYEPDGIFKELSKCDSWGNLTLFLADRDRHIQYRLPTYYAATLFAGAWVEPGHGLHEAYPVDCDIADARGRPLITGYALKRPDGRWSLMLINKDSERAYTVSVKLEGADSDPLGGPMDLYQYGADQFEWIARGKEGFPIRDLPPLRRIEPDSTRIPLPRYSITVVKESDSLSKRSSDRKSRSKQGLAKL